MKNKFALFLLSFISTAIFAQGVNDSTSMEMLYTNQVFYSFENGEVSSITNEDWNIAFSLSGEGALGSSIILNEATSNLWAVPNDTSYWAAFDSTGYDAWQELLNADSTWTNGAFNKYRGADGFFDLGWGILDPENNYWTFGDSLYLIKLGDDSFKKLWIESLKTGVWQFKYANLDGTDEIEFSIDKADYPTKNFIYFSLETGSIIDREPANSAWDIMFTKHRDEVVPGVIVGVTSVFNNVGLWTARSDEADLDAALNATTPTTEFEQNVVNIGRTWKKFSGGTWAVYDSIAYFAWNIDSTALFRIVFTDFGGMTTGKSFFNIKKQEVAAIQKIELIQHALYPNPTNGAFTINTTNTNEETIDFTIFTTSGTLVFKTILTNTTQQINVRELPAGIYIYTLNSANKNSTGKLIIQ